jgi:hypothetical protein
MTYTQKEILSYAERLASFVNCRGRIAVDEFDAKNEGFFPPHFLDDNRPPRVSRPPGVLPRPGEETEAEWVPTWFGFQIGLFKAWQDGFPADWAVTLIALTHSKTRFEAWPYQRALMFLAIEPWRARFCAICSRGFVAEKPATRFCSVKCAAGARKASRTSWWRKNGESWRRQREKKRSPLQKRR